MRRFLKGILKLTIEQAILLGSGLFVFGISICPEGLVGILRTEINLLRLLLGGMGLLMSTVVFQAIREESKISALERELTDTMYSTLNVREIVNPESGVEYLAKRVLSTKKSFDHIALSPKLPRWYNSTSHFEDELQKIALTNRVRLRYIANFEDGHRLKRVQKLVTDPDIHNYHVSSYVIKEGSPRFPNVMIFDDEEVVLGLPGFGESDTFLSITNQEVAEAFEKYFYLLWAEGILLDRNSINDFSNDSKD